MDHLIFLLISLMDSFRFRIQDIYVLDEISCKAFSCVAYAGKFFIIHLFISFTVSFHDIIRHLIFNFTSTMQKK